MMIRQKHHLAILLLSLGMLLLGAFLVIFLKKNWDDEEAGLRRETNLLFSNAVHGIESQMFDKLLVRKWKTSGSDTTVSIALNLPGIPPPKDSARMMTFIQERSMVKETCAPELRKDTQESQLQIIVKSDHSGNKTDMSGALSMLVSSDSMHPMMLQSLEKSFGEAIERSGLPLQWSILQTREVPADSLAASPGAFVAGRYADLLSGEQLRVEISGYKPYLLKKIAPQILFSILLYACVGLAFLFVYQSFRKQARLAEMKNDFIRNMTHELKTPISTVNVAIEALQHFDVLQDPERTREYLSISRNELNRLTLLVDKVLRMSLFEEGAGELKTEALDLRALVEEVLGAMKLQFEKYRAQVSFHFSGSDFRLNGDRLHLLSVVYNLLENALKYSNLPPKIEVQLSEKAQTLELKVLDEGKGIPAEYLDKIFEKFFRVPTGDVHDVKGHGLGLHYVAGVVRLHQGSIAVESREGFGTAFILRFPVELVA